MQRENPFEQNLYICVLLFSYLHFSRCTIDASWTFEWRYFKNVVHRHILHSCRSIALTTSTLTSFSSFTAQYSTFTAASFPSRLHSGFFPFTGEKQKRTNSKLVFLKIFHSPSQLSPSCQSHIHPPLLHCPLLHIPAGHLTPLSRTLLRPACWNTRWRTAVGVAAGVSVQLGVGVPKVEEGAISTSSQRQWWWSSAHCSSAPLVLYGLPSPPPSSLDPKRKKIISWCLKCLPSYLSLFPSLVIILIMYSCVLPSLSFHLHIIHFLFIAN